jgi:hypothetical protein
MVNVGEFLICKVLFMRYLFCIALILVVTSCATTLRTYPGDKRPTSEIAVLTVQNFFNSNRNTNITNVDGKTIIMKAIGSLELLPGEHLISVECSKSYNVFTPRAINHYSDNLKINVMAGHSYRVEFQNKQFCLKDLTVNTTVTCGDSAKGVRRKGSGIGVFVFPIF